MADVVMKPWLGIHPDWYCAFGLSVLKNIIKVSRVDSECILCIVNTKRRKVDRKGKGFLKKTILSSRSKGLQSHYYYNQ